MANQMIALQARSPQLPDPSRRTAQFVNMMNMTRQQEAAQRQAEQAQQAMTIEAAKEARAAELHGPALTKAQQDNILQALEIFREGVADIAEGDVAAAEAVRADLVARVPGWDKVLPPATSWDRNTRYRLMVDAAKEMDKTFATPVASLEVGVDGTPRSVVVGNFPGAAGQSPVYDTPETSTPPRTPSTPTAGADMRATQGANTTPQDLIDQGMNPNSIPSGMPTVRPASFNQSDMGGADAGQMTPEVMSRIVDSAFQTGVMAQVDFDQLLATQPPQNKQALVDSFRRANITLQADAPSLADSAMGQQPPMAVNPVQTPQAEFAVYRGQPREQTLAQTQPRTITRIQQRTPNVSPAPAETPEQAGRRALLSRSSPAEEGAKTQATENVRLNMAPQIAAATKKAENAIALKSEAPKEKYIATRLIANIDDRIATIDRLLRNPERRSIVGRLEGRIPYALQNETQSDAQADFDKIKNTDTLTSLVELKQDSPGGGSPVGNASNSDVKLVAGGANALIQSGSLSKFDAELMDIRRQLYRTRTNAINFYDDRYADVIAGDPRLKLNAPKIADRYISTKDLPKQKTPIKTPTSRLSAETRAKYGL